MPGVEWGGVLDLTREGRGRSRWLSGIVFLIFWSLARAILREVIKSTADLPTTKILISVPNKRSIDILSPLVVKARSIYLRNATPVSGRKATW